MAKPKLIGLLCTWCAEDWIIPLLKETSYQCDEVMVNVSPHSPSMIQYKDNTYDLVRNFKSEKNNITIVDTPNNLISHHAEIKPMLLNIMLQKSKYYDINNWIWIRDDDEFYTTKSCNNIKKLIQTVNCDQFLIQELFFMINTKLYLNGEHNRLFRINSFEDRFYPAQRWSGTKLVALVPKDLVCMFHYCMLTNPHAKIDFWKEEYPGKEQTKKITWIDKIYRNYDIYDEGKWIEENYKLTGCYSPWFDINFKPDTFGKLYRYKGKHPKVIQNSKLIKIKDFRKEYNF